MFPEGEVVLVGSCVAQQGLTVACDPWRAMMSGCCKPPKCNRRPVYGWTMAWSTLAGCALPAPNSNKKVFLVFCARGTGNCLSPTVKVTVIMSTVIVGLLGWLATACPSCHIDCNAKVRCYRSAGYGLPVLCNFLQPTSST